MKNDVRLQQHLLDELRWVPSGNAAAASEVRNDAVAGHGPADRHADNRGSPAQWISGTRAVADPLNALAPPPQVHPGAGIATAVGSDLSCWIRLPGRSIEVVEGEGWIMLNRSVGWQYERLVAFVAVRPLDGVEGVIGQISITAPLVAGVDRQGSGETLHRGLQVSVRASRRD